MDLRNCEYRSKFCGKIAFEVCTDLELGKNSLTFDGLVRLGYILYLG